MGEGSSGAGFSIQGLEITLSVSPDRHLAATWYSGGYKARSCVVAVHGIFTDQREFGNFPVLLARRGISVLTFDAGGHGRSSGRRGYLSRTSHWKDLQAVIAYALQQCPQGKLWILGHSFGSHVALRAIADSSSLAGGILVAPQIRSGDSLRGVRRLMFLILGSIYTLMPFLPGVYIRNTESYENLYSDARAAVLAQQVAFIAPKKNVKVCRYAIASNNLSNVGRIRKPVLFIACSDDKQIPTERVRRLAALAPPAHSEFQVLRGSGHSPFMDQSRDCLVDMVARFCEVP